MGQESLLFSCVPGLFQKQIFTFLKNSSFLWNKREATGLLQTAGTDWALSDARDTLPGFFHIMELAPVCRPLIPADLLLNREFGELR
ncbi:MAG: hypothetical protein CME32_30955 [Gimesia sp.]|nr:hypothetical protein [Gimesia sp.]